MGVDLFMERSYPPFTMGGGGGGGGGEGRKRQDKGRSGGLTSLPYPFHFPSHWANTSTFYQAWMLRWFITVSLPPPSHPSSVFFRISQTEASWVYKNSWGEGRILGCPCPPPPTPFFFLSKTRHGGWYDNLVSTLCLTQCDPLTPLEQGEGVLFQNIQIDLVEVCIRSPLR